MAKNSKKKTSPSASNYYSIYKLLGKRLTNKINKLTSYVRKNPNDKQAKKSLDNLTGT